MSPQTSNVIHNVNVNVNINVNVNVKAFPMAYIVARAPRLTEWSDPTHQTVQCGRIML